MTTTPESITKNCIKNLIFDFGGVIIDIDFQRTIDAFRNLGAGDFDRKYGKAAQSGIFDDLDRGQISEQDFLMTLQSWLPEGTSLQQVKDAWNLIIIGIPERRIRLLESLKARYNLMLLSNTNIIHYDLYIPDLKKRYGYRDLSALFDHVFLSFKLGMRKPDREIFDHVYTATGFDRNETVFIDDSLHIVEAAQSYGIPSIWLQDGVDVCDLFRDGVLMQQSLLD
jgi:putative hydrolase of the HAD superfamily